MDEIGVEVVGQRNTRNRGVRQRTLGNDLGLEGFGIGTAFLLHERPLKKARNGVHLKSGGHHRLRRRSQVGVLPGRLPVSNIFSIIWKAVKQADKSFEKGVFKGATHAGNWIPSAIVRIAEEEKQYEYDRLKGSKICQISEVIYSLILDDPDGSFKIPLPRYTAEVMRPVLEGISSAKDAKIA